jgi:hypothetical protein
MPLLRPARFLGFTGVGALAVCSRGVDSTGWMGTGVS